ncbi:MAG: LrgB family protein [Lachnospiraceae bacterium]
MEEMLQGSTFFGIAITIFTYSISYKISKKYNKPILNPIILSTLMIIVFLLLTGVSVETYQKGAQFIDMFLVPLTVCLAIPLYRQIHILKQKPVLILTSVLSGCVVHLFAILGLTMLIGMEDQVRNSLFGKSVTTAIAIGISDEMGGIQSLTIIAVMIAGITGAIVGPSILKLIKITNPIAFGLAMGTASHAVATSRALEIGEVEGAMSSLAIVIAGIMTVVLVPLFMSFL